MKPYGAVLVILQVIWREVTGEIKTCPRCAFWKNIDAYRGNEALTHKILHMEGFKFPDCSNAEYRKCPQEYHFCTILYDTYDNTQLGKYCWPSEFADEYGCRFWYNTTTNPPTNLTIATCTCDPENCVPPNRPTAPPTPSPVIPTDAPSRPILPPQPERPISPPVLPFPGFVLPGGLAIRRSCGSVANPSVMFTLMASTTRMLGNIWS